MHAMLTYVCGTGMLERKTVEVKYLVDKRSKVGNKRIN